MKFFMDTDDMNFEQVNNAVQELRKIRARKADLHDRVSALYAMASNMKEAQMTWVNRHTGEVFDPSDWELYDETTNTFYHE